MTQWAATLDIDKDIIFLLWVGIPMSPTHLLSFFKLLDIKFIQLAIVILALVPYCLQYNIIMYQDGKQCGYTKCV